MKAVVCPVCSGSGKYQDKSCHGCCGSGWVEVHEETVVLPYPSYPLDPPIYKITYDYGLSDRCPSCGGDRYSSAGTGCPKGSHYGSYCEVT